MKLFTYFRSSAAYRVRIVLNLKGIPCELEPVHLLRDGGQHRAAPYLALNPAGLVPALELDDGRVLSQSLAIMEYLEEAHPNPPLLPCDAIERAWVRSLANLIACDVHPINNLRVLQYLENHFACSDDVKTRWYQHWVGEGLQAFESMLVSQGKAGKFCFGDEPSLADCCLVPQVYNARRFACDLSGVPTIQRVVNHCETIAAFAAAAPDRQPDAGL